MSKWQFAALSFVVIVAVVGVLFWKHKVDIAAQRAETERQAQASRREQAQARFDALVKELARISDLERTFSNELVAYGHDSTDATEAGQVRHDSSDDDVRVAKAKQELRDVSALEDIIQRERSTLIALADAFTDLLGDGPVNGFRATSGQFTQDEDFSQTRWERAIGYISDSLKNDTYVSEDVGQLYDESADYQTRANTQFEQLTHQKDELDKQVQGRIDKAKSELDAMGGLLSQTTTQKAMPSSISRSATDQMSSLMLTSENAQMPINHVSDKIVANVQARFIKAFKEGGISQVVTGIRSCYAATNRERTTANESAVVSCLLYDLSAFQLNQGMVQSLVAEGFPGAGAPPAPGTAMAYLSKSAFIARLRIYANIPFGDNTEAFARYFDGAPNKIILAATSAP